MQHKCATALVCYSAANLYITSQNTDVITQHQLPEHINSLEEFTKVPNSQSKSQQTKELYISMLNLWALLGQRRVSVVMTVTGQLEEVTSCYDCDWSV